MTTIRLGTSWCSPVRSAWTATTLRVRRRRSGNPWQRATSASINHLDRIFRAPNALKSLNSSITSCNTSKSYGDRYDSRNNLARPSVWISERQKPEETILKKLITHDHNDD